MYLFGEDTFESFDCEIIQNIQRSPIPNPNERDITFLEDILSTGSNPCFMLQYVQNLQ